MTPRWSLVVGRCATYRRGAETRRFPFLALSASASLRFVAVIALSLGAATAYAQGQPGLPGSMTKPGSVSTDVPQQLADVTFEQRLNTALPLDARFRDERGHHVALGDFFGRKPVVLAFVYYQCPMLCTQIFNGVAGALKAVPFQVGQDFDVVFVSFDPRDTPEAAAAKKAALLADYKQEAAAGGWHFLTGDLTNAEGNIRRVTNAAGFSYRWDEQSQQFAHVSGVLVVTPDGRLSRYFYGVEFSPKELRMALAESSEGKVGSLVEQLLLYCYHYNPSTGRYGAITMNLVRIGGAFTVMLIGGFIWLMRRKEIANPPITTPSAIGNR